MTHRVFAFLSLSGGPIAGAVVRDMKLANEIHRRGHPVLVYWLYGRTQGLLGKGIRQRILCLGTPGAGDAAAHPASADDFIQQLVVRMCDGGASDAELIDRLLDSMQKDGVTDLFPTFAMLCPLAMAAKACGRHRFEYLATFQGEEVFANYAQRAGRSEDYHLRLQEAVSNSRWPAIAVSHDYARRIRDEMGIDESRLRVIYPGIELPAGAPPGYSVLTAAFGGLSPALPVVAYVGRQDSEKGIDLLLYAARILKQRGIEAQWVISGAACFGDHYRQAIRQIAEHLRLPVFQSAQVTDTVRNALYAHSRCIVYPSIHREPFGLVAAEALSFGTPVLVPDHGGITEVIEWEGRCGGLTFRAWDSGDLAAQLERLLRDEKLHRELCGNTRRIAARFNVAETAAQVLAHVGAGA